MADNPLGGVDVSDSRHTTLYRFYAADDSLLYVGITHRVEGRFSVHKKEKPWDQIARVTLEHFPSRDEALRAESLAIQSEKPQWNIVGIGSEAKRQSSRSWHSRASALWPDAEWIAGNNRYALVAYCRVTTVTLHASLGAAEIDKAHIDRTACGGFCGRDHHIFDLERGPW
jgi:predicted GIY-YIG superfamily endonuclease